VAHKQSLSVVFVCTGNICRSPIAEKIFAEHLRRAGLDGQVRVGSAGTGGWNVGSPADPRTTVTGERRTNRWAASARGTGNGLSLL
jgi:protein-tyrosine phosphatase